MWNGAWLISCSSVGASGRSGGQIHCGDDKMLLRVLQRQQVHRWLVFIGIVYSLGYLPTTQTASLRTSTRDPPGAICPPPFLGGRLSTLGLVGCFFLGRFAWDFAIRTVSIHLSMRMLAASLDGNVDVVYYSVVQPRCCPRS